MIFDFKKILYDQPTDSRGYATTFGVNLDGLTEQNVTNSLSFLLDHFLEGYVEENKAFCR